MSMASNRLQQKITLPDRVSQLYYAHGLFCSSHPVLVLSCAAFVVLLCCYPLLSIPLPGNAPQQLVGQPSAINATESENLSYGEQASLPRWLSGPPLLYVHQILLRVAVCPWAEDLLLTDAFRAPLSEVFRLLESVANYQHENSSKTLSDVCLHVESAARLKPEQRALLPEYNCLMLSPASLWRQEPGRFLQDPTPLHTVFNYQTLQRGKVSLAEMLLGLNLKDTGIKRYPLRSRQRVLQYAVTLFLRVHDSSFMDGLHHKLRQMYPLHQQTVNATGTNNSAFSVDRNTFEQLPMIHIYYPGEFSARGLIPLIATYLLMFLYMYFSMRKIELLKSKFGVSVSAALTVLASLFMSVGLCFFFGLTLTLSGREFYPYLVVIVGLENVFVLTKSVVSTPAHLDVKIRVAQGLSREGWSITKNLLTEVTILTIGLFTLVPAIQEFCIFAIVGLLSDFFLQVVFFSTILAMDIRRAALDSVSETQSYHSSVRQNNPQASRQAQRSTLSRSRSHPRLDLGDYPTSVVAPPIGPTYASTVLVPKRLRLVHFWARTRIVQRGFMLFMILWIGAIAINSGVVEQLLEASVTSSQADTNTSKMPSVPAASWKIRPADPPPMMHLPTPLPIDDQSKVSCPRLWSSSPWPHTSPQHWSSILSLYNISLAGNYLTVLPPLRLAMAVSPDRARTLRRPGDEDAGGWSGTGAGQWQALVAALDPVDLSSAHVMVLERAVRHTHPHSSGDNLKQLFLAPDERHKAARNVNLNEEKGKPKVVPSIASIDTASLSKMSNNHSGDDIKKQDNHVVELKEELTFMSSTEDLKKKESILKRIPTGAEATTVLVGAVDFLEQPTIAFVRLAEGILMPSITEVTIPVRFLFILLGPTTADLDYHEIGRSISTLMSNAQFHKIAYKATERKELLSAINEFLDESIVLPPGDWERRALLEVEELKAKSKKIRQRKNTRLLTTDEAKKALLPPGDETGKPPFDDDPLRRTRKPFGGLINDIKRRYPHYISDIKDGLNLPSIAAAIFMYFAALSGAITFGGLMGDKTDNWIGISETLIATSASGILFALFSGQPLIIIGATGPLLLFDESLYNFCLTNQINFLALRVFIGFWLTIIALIVVCFEGSVLVKLFTRFTEEIFAALISVLYIVESVQKLFMVFLKHPLREDYCSDGLLAVASGQGNSSFFGNDSSLTTQDIEYIENVTTFEWVINNSTESPFPTVFQVDKSNQPNTALFCLILALGTFFIAYYLRQFRNSKFLGRSARRALGDFGVPIAIIIMVTLDFLVPATYTEKLKVPEGLSPSNPTGRGWIISPGDLEYVWLAFAACAPALLVYILLFMETHICELIIDKKDRKLKKGSGFHLDILLVCLMNTGCGLMGAPWVCAATVRSIAHVSAVTIMSRTHAPGEKPHIIEVKEQRLSSFLVAVMVGISVLMAPLLRLVPISVLFGVFLYMGVSSTNGIQFFERLQLFFMPVKHHPQVPYVRRVPTMKMHLFTIIQLMCLALLWIVKSTEASLAFPFFLILMVPLRAQLRCLFSPAELRALDSEEADGDKEEEPDFYTEAPLPG